MFFHVVCLFTHFFRLKLSANAANSVGPNIVRYEAMKWNHEINIPLTVRYILCIWANVHQMIQVNVEYSMRNYVVKQKCRKIIPSPSHMWSSLVCICAMACITRGVCWKNSIDKKIHRQRCEVYLQVASCDVRQTECLYW